MKRAALAARFFYVCFLYCNNFIYCLMRILFLYVALLLTSIVIKAQTTFNINGPANNTLNYIAYTHAIVYVNANTVLNDATIVVKQGKIERITAQGAVPKNAIEVNLKGKVVYPSFIDLYSNYGIDVPSFNKNKNNGEQFNSNKAGAFAWNEAIKPEINAAQYFNYNHQDAIALRTMGIGAVITGNQDGILRGTTALVTTANDEPHYTIVGNNITSSFSFNKGNSPQPYPSSLMGSIALIRQTYYDAKWYVAQQKEKNLSLEAFVNLSNLPVIFDAGNKQNVLRAAAIAKEFNAKYIIKTNGDEYQRVQEIKQTNLPLIVPVNFPKPYKINTAFDAELISTSDLKHWELAPANLYFLWKNKIKFCITAQGSKEGDFLNNIRKAVKYGLPKQEAIKALTENPASFINANNLGDLKDGKIANFIICDGDLFDDETSIMEIVIQGKSHKTNNTPDVVLANEYKINSNITLYLKKNIATINNDTFKLKASYHAGIANFILDGKTLINYTANATIIDSAQYPYNIKELSGFARLSNQTIENWVAIVASNQNKKQELKDSVTILSDSLIWYPFNDFGNNILPQAKKVHFKNATIWTNEQQGILTQTDVIITNGKITAIGKQLPCSDCEIIDATGKHLTNGIIDEHSHIAITHGVNEGTQAVTSEVRIGDAVNADDINIYRQLAGGVIAAQLLHGSANPIGGQSALIKLRWGASPDKMKIENAAKDIKFALGENVKQANWGDGATTRYPQTRMGVEQVFIDAFTRAREYERKLKTDKTLRKDLELDALVEILNSNRFITCHSYVQSEINMLMHVADTFGFKVNTFTHILEGYKVADKMKKHGVNASTFADWWAYKYEVIDAIPQNAAILNRMGVTVAINSDDAEMGRRLNHEAAKIVKYGKITEEEAWKMVTLNPAKMLRIDSRTGSIKQGKDADIVLWNNNPLSIYAKPEMTFVDGICYYSTQTDELLRKQVAATRARLISNILQAQKNGADTQTQISEQEPNYHCND